MSDLDLGIVSDEIALDFGEALVHGLKWGIRIYELRCLRTGRVPSVDASELVGLRRLVADSGVSISALSPGIFKHPVSNKRELELELSETLPRSLSMAAEFGASLLIVFGFKMDDQDRNVQTSLAVEYMARAVEEAKKAGIRIAIENEPGFLCDSGANTAKFIRRVGSPFLGANWDPCNGYGTSEQPYPEGYRALKEHIVNVHVKDTKKGSLIQCVPVGEGMIDWKGQIRSLLEDRIVRHVTIETHCLPLVENSQRNVDTLRSYLRELSPTRRTSV